MVIRNVSILDFDKFKIKEHSDIYIKNGIIEKIVINNWSNEQNFINNYKNNRSNEKKLDKNQPIIDGTNYYVLPGLTNMHSHTAMTLLRGSAEDVNSHDWFNKYIWKYEKNLNPEDVYFGTLLGAVEMLENGITFVADHYFYMEEAYKAYMESGIRADLAWALFGTGDNSENEFKDALEFIEKYKKQSQLIILSLGPHSPYICPEIFLKKIVKLSEEYDLKIHIHVSEEKWQIEKSLKEKGKTPIEYLDKLGILKENTILAHAFLATDKEIELIKQKMSIIAHAPKTYLRFGFIGDIMVKALEKGVKISLATDGAASNMDLSIFEAGKLAAILAKIATKNAESGRVNEIFPLLFNGLNNIGYSNTGQIKEGYNADLILIKKDSTHLNPAINVFANILYNINKNDIDYVIVNGKIIVKKGVHQYVDKLSLLKEVNKIKIKLLKADGGPMQSFGV